MDGTWLYSIVEREMTKEKQFFYSYCGQIQGWCSSTRPCKCTRIAAPHCKYFMTHHPLSSKRVELMPQETKDWLNELVGRKKE